MTDQAPSMGEMTMSEIRQWIDAGNSFTYLAANGVEFEAKKYGDVYVVRGPGMNTFQSLSGLMHAVAPPENWKKT